MEGSRSGLARACADDIGGVVKQLQTLRILTDVMQTAGKVATLALKLTKRLLAPLHAPSTEQLAAFMRDSIRDVAPFVANIQV
eukprot:4550905-Pyramimonas_sp.AAC.1